MVKKVIHGYHNNILRKDTNEIQYEHCEIGKYPFIFPFNISSSMCLSYKEENVLSCIPYAGIVGSM